MTFDLRQQYNTVLPLPERKPVEEMDKLLTDLNTTSTVNKNLYNTQLSAFNIQTPDPEAQAIINKKRDEFIGAANDMVQRGDYAYMGKFLQDEANKYIQDRYIQLAGTDAKEFESQLDVIRDNQKLNPLHATTLINDVKNNYKFNYDTETGVYRKANVFKPYEDPDINKQLVSLSNTLKANASSSTGIKYVNSQGEEVSEMSDAAKNLIVKNTDGREYVDAPRLKTFMQRVLKNDSAMLGYLVQDYVVKNKDQFAGQNLSKIIEDTIQGKNPAIIEEVLTSTTTDLANTLAYNQSIKVKDLDNININEQEKSNGVSSQIYSSNITGNVKNINNDSESLAQAAKDTENALIPQLRQSIFASSPKGNIPKGDGVVTKEAWSNDILAANEEFKNGNNKAVYDLASQYKLSPEQTSKLFGIFDANRIQSDALNQKINYAKQKVLSNPNITGKEYIDFNTEGSNNNDVLVIKGLLSKLGVSIEELRNKYKKSTDVQNVQDYIKENKLIYTDNTGAVDYSGYPMEKPLTEEDKSFNLLKNKIDDIDGFITSGLAGKLKKETDKELKNMSSNTVGYNVITGLDFANVAPTKEDKSNLTNAAYNIREKVKYGKDLLELNKDQKEKINNALPEQIEPVSIIPGNVYNGKYPAIIYRFVQKPISDNKQEVIEFTLPIDNAEGVMTSSLENYMNSPRHIASVLLNTPIQMGIPTYADSKYGYTVDITGGKNPEMKVVSPNNKTYSRNEALNILEEAIILKEPSDIIKNNFQNIESEVEIGNYITNSINDNEIDNNLQKYIDVLIEEGQLDANANIKDKIALVGRILYNLKR
jgi:hypothetical protein